MNKLLLITLLAIATTAIAEDTPQVSTQDTPELAAQSEQTAEQKAPTPVKTPKKTHKANRPTNRPENNDNYNENDPGLDAQLILGKVQQMVNGVFNIAKDPHNSNTIETSVANIFGGLAAIASHAAQRNMFKNQPVQLNNFFENLSDDFKKELLAYALAHANEFEQELGLGLD